MINVYLAGASGLTGSELFNLLLEDSRINSIALINRNGVWNEKHPKLSGGIHSFELLPQQFPAGKKLLFMCLGTTIKKAGTREAFMFVDYELPARLATWAERNSFDAIVWVSAVDANADSGNFYLSVKGKLENYVRTLSIPSKVVVRPSLLLGKRKESRPAERLAIVASPLLNLLAVGPWKKYRCISVVQVAKAMLSVGIESPIGFTVVESPRLFEF